MPAPLPDAMSPTPPWSPTDPPRELATHRTPLLLKQEFDIVFADWLDRIQRTIETGGGGSSWALVGIKRRGAVLARRLHSALRTEHSEMLHGEIDISLYRDDYHLRTEKPMVLGSRIPFRVEGLKILLVDDVLFTGRTVRAAMDLILDFGRPRLISLAVFVDRGHRELPIAANLVGREVPTERDDQVLVTLEEMGEADGVELVRKAGS